MGSGRLTEEQRREAFAGIKMWKAGGQRAPHKPLVSLNQTWHRSWCPRPAS
jgi:hypothetical protein